ADLRRNPALCGILLDIVDHLDFGRRVIADHLAGFLRRHMAVARGLDRLALLFGISPQRLERLHASFRRAALGGLRRARRRPKSTRATHDRRYTGAWER